MKYYQHLFSPVKIGSMEVKNRIFMSAMGTTLSDRNNEVTDELIAYYEERAKGGVGLITTEVALIDRGARYCSFQNLGIYRDEQIEGLKRLTDAVHQYGAKIAPQLMHPGAAGISFFNDGREPVAASPVPIRSFREVPRPLSVEEIHEITRQYGQAALRARRAGFDAVELHCCHGHGLLGRFVSALGNKRNDAYGGDMDGRLRFPLEVIAEMRKMAGEDFPIIVRMSACEEEPGGLSVMESLYMAQQFEAAGVGMIHLSNGSMDNPWHVTSPMDLPEGAFADHAERLKRVVRIPVGVVGKQKEPWIGEMTVSLGKADVVYMGRALLCDPQLPQKAMEGNSELIRPCISCNTCINSVKANKVVTCRMNPRAGRETERDPVAAGGKSVLVIGGGPAGLSAAAETARLGHRVVLIEKRDILGGQMYLAGFPPCKKDIPRATKYLIDEAVRSGVEIRTQCEANAELVVQMQPDLVVLATGGAAVVPGFLKGCDRVVTAWDALEGKVLTGNEIAVIGGGIVGCETADFLAHPHHDLTVGAKKVTIFEKQNDLMETEKSSGRSTLIMRLLEKNCKIITGAEITEVAEGTIRFRRNGEECTLSGFDTVVSAVGTRSQCELKEQFEQHGCPVIVVGDALSPGNIGDAVRTGFEAARSL